MKAPFRIFLGLYRRALGLYPASFRNEWSHELVRTLVALDREARVRGPLARVRLWLRELRGVVRSAWSLRRTRFPYRGGPGRWDALRQDVGFAVRVLVKNRGLSLAAILMLALGIGANTAIFSLANGIARVVERFEDPDGLVFVWGTTPRWDRRTVSAADYLDWKGATTAFESLETYTTSQRFVTGDGEPERLSVVATTPRLFPLLGVVAARGRLFASDDAAPGAAPVAVVAYRYWLERFGARDDILGATLVLDDVPHTIVGVLPAELEFDMFWRGVRAFTPLALDGVTADRTRRGHYVVGRLAEGVAFERAQEEVAALADRIAAAHPELEEPLGARLQSFRDYFFGADDRLAMGMLLLAVVAVLLIACVNLANLLLARGTARQPEIALRRALGASRRRIVGQLLTESALLTLVGAALGLLLGMWGLDLLIAAFAASTTPLHVGDVGIDAALLTYTTVISTAAALSFGLAPALLASRGTLGAGIKEGRAGSSAGRSRRRLRSGILVVQIALTVPLVLSCAIAFRQVQALSGLDLGFRTEELLTARVDLPAHRYVEPAARSAFFDRLLDAAARAPGITSVGAGMNVPVGGGYRTQTAHVRVVEREGTEAGAADVFGFEVVTPGYFAALGVPLVAGRAFAATDGPADAPVAILNERAAERFWPGEEALGRRLVVDSLRGVGSGLEPTTVTVVGVVADFGATFRGEPPYPAVFLPGAQRPLASLRVVARTEGEPLARLDALRAAVARLDADVPIAEIRTGERIVRDWLMESRIVAGMLGLLGVLALGLAVVGLYGLVAYSVAQRRTELGVRMVLGASPRALRAAVTGSFVRLAAYGIGGGLLLSGAIASAARAALFIVTVPWGSTTAGLVLLLTGVVALASWLPARGATRIEPSRALRAE